MLPSPANFRPTPEEQAMTSWRGVFPAITTQFKPDQTIDSGATAALVERLIKAGCHGIIVNGTLGEGSALEADEKRAVIKLAIETARGRVPVLDRRRRIHDQARLPARGRRREARRGGPDGAAGDGLQVGFARDARALPHRRARERPADHGLQQPDFLRRGREARDVRRARRRSGPSSRSRNPRTTCGASPTSSTPAATATRSSAASTISRSRP